MNSKSNKVASPLAAPKGPLRENTLWWSRPLPHQAGLFSGLAAAPDRPSGPASLSQDKAYLIGIRPSADCRGRCIIERWWNY